MSGPEEQELRDDVTALRMLLTETTAERDRWKITAQEADAFIRQFNEADPDGWRAIVAERDRLRAVVDNSMELFSPYLDHLEGCAVETDYPCDCGFDLLDGSPDMGGSQ